MVELHREACWAAADLEGAFGPSGQRARFKAFLSCKLRKTSPSRPPGGGHLSAFATQSLSVSGARPSKLGGEGIL